VTVEHVGTVIYPTLNMANTSKKFIENRNQIEALHNEWCAENGYPVKWSKLQAGRPKLNEETKAIKKYVKRNGAI
jgi:hypothetical protein